MWHKHDLLNRATELDKIGICPHCWKTHDAATAVGTPLKLRPKPGDLTCCMRCGEFSMFAEDLDLVPIPVEIMQQLPLDVLDALEQARAHTKSWSQNDDKL